MFKSLPNPSSLISANQCDSLYVILHNQTSIYFAINTETYAIGIKLWVTKDPTDIARYYLHKIAKG